MRPALRLLLAFITGVALVLPLTISGPAAEATTSARYIILFQGDGMAAQHIRAGACYVCGYQPCLAWETFPNQTTMTTNNATGELTDSAASATAMATGVKVDNTVVSAQLPGDGSELRTLLEIHRDAGKSTGLVTTAFLTDASPAAYGAHEASRYHGAAIFRDFVTQTRPNVLLGGGGNGFDSALATGQGYTVVADRTALLALDTETATRVAGGFGSGIIPPVDYPRRSTALPTLPEMTQTALRILDNDPDGFFVFIEHEGIDESSHASDATNLVRSLAELSNAVQAAVDWVNDPGNDADWNNTLILVVGDHETGGITDVVNNGAGNVPAIAFTTTGHTAAPVSVSALGAGASQITGAQIDITDIFGILGPAPASATTFALSSSHIGDLDGSRTVAGKNWGVKVTIAVHDANNAPAPGAAVTGIWSEGASGAVTCTTGTRGVCSVFKSNLNPAVSSVTFTVRNVTKTGYTYISAGNHDADGGSEGTTITIPK